MIEVKKLSLINFYKYRINKHGLGYLFKLTSSYYPRFLSLGYYSSEDKEIVLADVGNVKLRKAHEVGHAVGKGHTWKPGYIMFPLGVLRGWRE